MRGVNAYLNYRKIPLIRPASLGELTARALLVATPYLKFLVGPAAGDTGTSNRRH